MKSLLIAFSLLLLGAPGETGQTGSSTKTQDSKQVESSEQGSGQMSLAELARKTRESRSKERNVKAYTNANYRKGGGGFIGGGSSRSRATGAAGKGGEKGAEDKAKPSKDAQSEEAQKLGEVKRQIDTAKLSYLTLVNTSQVLQLRMNDLRNRFLNQSDGATQERLNAALSTTLQELKSNTIEIRESRKALDRIVNEARAEGFEKDVLKSMVGDLPEPKKIVDDDFDFSKADYDS